MDRMDYMMDDASQPQVAVPHHHCQVSPIHLPHPSQHGLPPRGAMSREGHPFDPVHDSNFSNQTPSFMGYAPTQYQSPNAHMWTRTTPTHPGMAQPPTDPRYISPYAYMNAPPGLPDPRFSRSGRFTDQPYATSNVRNDQPNGGSPYPPNERDRTARMLQRLQQDQAQMIQRLRQDNARRAYNLAQAGRPNPTSQGPTPLAHEPSATAPGPPPESTNWSPRASLSPYNNLSSEMLNLVGMPIPQTPQQDNDVESRARPAPSASNPRNSQPGAAGNAEEGRFRLRWGRELVGFDEDLEALIAIDANPRLVSAIQYAMVTEGRYGKKRPSQETLSTLISMTVDEVKAAGEETSCMICYNDFGVANPEGLTEQPLRLPKCKHIFGDICIKKWFEDSDTCPYCRDKLPSELSSKRSRMMERLLISQAARPRTHQHSEDDNPEVQLRRFQHHRDMQRQQLHAVRGNFNSPERRRPPRARLSANGGPPFRSQVISRPVVDAPAPVPPSIPPTQEPSQSRFGIVEDTSSNPVSPAVAVGSSPIVNVHPIATSTTERIQQLSRRMRDTQAQMDELAGYRDFTSGQIGGHARSDNLRINQENFPFNSALGHPNPNVAAPNIPNNFANTGPRVGSGTSDDWAQFAQRWN